LTKPKQSSSSPPAVVWGTTPDSVEAQAEELDRAFTAIGIRPSPGETWAVKVNLTYPQPDAGVVTSAATAEGLALWAVERGVRIVWVESDGGNNSHKASDVLPRCGFLDLAARYGGSIRSLTDDRWVLTPMTVARREFALELSDWMLARPFDRFVSMPVIKTHIFTTVTLGIKNLWGCIPNPLRMYNHHLLSWGIVGLAKTLAPDLVIYDGRTVMDGNGPINGRPIPARTLAIATASGTGDWEVTRAMGIRPASVRHLRLARSEGLADRGRIIGQPPSTFPTQFRMERTLYNWGSMAAQLHPRLQKLVYHSPLSKHIYALVSPLRRGSRAESIRKHY
jgi:uncharacterized protein (DUF362 family)